MSFKKWQVHRYDGLHYQIAGKSSLNDLKISHNIINIKWKQNFVKDVNKLKN
jgi:hypothetical protein